MIKLTLLIYSTLMINNAQADIFGRDDRIEISSAGARASMGKSVAIGFTNSSLQRINNSVSRVWADELSDYMCSDEKFSRQKSIADGCTGFLVGDDLLVTAGHCVVNSGEVKHSRTGMCANINWMFDYTSRSNLDRVAQKNIYKCREVIYGVQKKVNETYHDFALIRLDRKVVGRKAFKITNSKAKNRESVFMIGHPMGLPMKYTSNGRVFNQKVGRSFYTNLDSFSGNSGSPVLNNQNEVTGVLVAGYPSMLTYTDYEYGCERYNRCDENGKNCRALPEYEYLDGFPNVYTEVQSITFYKQLIEAYK